MSQLNESRRDHCQVVDLVRLAQSGNRDAIGSLFEIFRPTVFAIALSVVGSLSDAEDLVQDVFLHLISKLGQLRDPNCFPGWLRSMTRRMALNRKMRVRALGTGSDEQVSWVPDDRELRPLENLLDEEERRLVHVALEHLKPSDRSTLEAHYMEHKPIAVMMSEFDAPEGTIKRRLHVARERLGRSFLALAGREFSDELGEGRDEPDS